MQATASPEIAGARNSRRNSSEPNRASAGVAMSVCTPIAIGTEPQCDAAELLGHHQRVGIIEPQPAKFDRLVEAEKAEIARVS